MCYPAVVVSCFALLAVACGSGQPAADAQAAAETGAAEAPHAGAPPQPVESPGPPLETPDPRPLRLLGPLVVPDTTEATMWLGRVDAIAYDPAADHLLVLDPQGRAVHEVTQAGRLVRSYGGKQGAGPGELRFAHDFGWSPSRVAIFATTNGKLVLFHRDNGRFASEFRTEAHHRDVALLGEDRVVFVPGAPGHAFDVYSIDGALIASRGDAAALGSLCDDPGCSRRTHCPHCEVVTLGDSLIVVAEMDRTRLVVFDTTGAQRAVLHFERDSELVRGWREEDGQNMTRPQAQGELLVMESKHYFLDISALPGGWLGIAVTPSGPVFRQAGREYWRVHPLERRIERFHYGGGTIGYKASSGAVVFAVDSEDGGIYRYAFPE